jgi:hypothetical protein
VGIEEIRQVTGKLTFLLVREARPVNDFLDVEVIVGLDTAPIARFGFKFGGGPGGDIIHHWMLDTLRDAFNNNWQTTIDYKIDISSNRDGIIKQVHISKETMRM